MEGVTMTDAEFRLVQATDRRLQLRVEQLEKALAAAADVLDDLSGYQHQAELSQHAMAKAVEFRAVASEGKLDRFKFARTHDHDMQKR